MIMESANLHHHHQQHQHDHQQNHQIQEHAQLVVGSSPSSSSTSCLGPNTQQHAWTPNVSLNNAVNYNQIYNGVLLVQPQSMIHNGEEEENMHNNINLSRIKQELSSSSSSTTTQTFPKFTEMLNTSKEDQLSDLSEKLLLKTISSGFPLNGDLFYSNAQNVSSFGSTVRGNFSQIYPTINISNLSSSVSSSSNNNNFDMNLEALDLLTSARFNGNNNFTNSSSHDHNLGLYKETLPFGIDQPHHHLQHSSRRLQSPTSPPKASPFSNEIASEPKRASGFIDPNKPPHASAPKKSRLDSRPCPPFKVRKEKLGDRIAALQQLVAPFGKTDTASVLMEAIGYIKFLQNQVETLSVPYMKSSRNKSTRPNQGLMTSEDTMEEPKRDLRSRGLCLVPLSCMSYVTNDGGGGGGIWPPPPNFGGGT